jgi:hypothetical protein
MQNLYSGTKISGGSVIALLGKLHHFSQSNCRQKQEKEPCQPADVSGSISPKEPSSSCNCQHYQSREPPAAIRHTGPPRAP